MDQNLRAEFDIPEDWTINQGQTSEKERINQSTEMTEFTAVSPNGDMKRTFVFTNFCNHKGCKTSWRETTND